MAVSLTRLTGWSSEATARALVERREVQASPERLLAVVARGHQDVYDLLLAQVGTRQWATVIWDRREVGRRRRQVPVSTERRRGERRRRPPEIWTTFGFLVVRPGRLFP